MVNHNSQQCREHKKIHILLHLAEDVGFGDNYNKPKCSILHVHLHVETYGFAVVVTEFKLQVSGEGSNSIDRKFEAHHGNNQPYRVHDEITRYDNNLTMEIALYAANNH